MSVSPGQLVLLNALPHYAIYFLFAFPLSHGYFLNETWIVERRDVFNIKHQAKAY